MRNAGEAGGLKAAALKSLGAGAPSGSGSVKWDGAAWQAQSTHSAGSWSRSQHIYFCAIHKDAQKPLELCCGPILLVTMGWKSKDSMCLVTSTILSPEFHSKVLQFCHFSVTLSLVELLIFHSELHCRMWLKLESFWKSRTWEEQARGKCPEQCVNMIWRGSWENKWVTLFNYMRHIFSLFFSFLFCIHPLIFNAFA